MDRNLNRGRGAAVLVGRIQGVGGGGRGRNGGAGAAGGPDRGRDDDVICAGDLPSQRHLRARRDGSVAGGKTGNGGIRTAGNIGVGVEG